MLRPRRLGQRVSRKCRRHDEKSDEWWWWDYFVNFCKKAPNNSRMCAVVARFSGHPKVCVVMAPIVIHVHAKQRCSDIHSSDTKSIGHHTSRWWWWWWHWQVLIIMTIDMKMTAMFFCWNWRQFPMIRLRFWPSTVTRIVLVFSSRAVSYIDIHPESLWYHRIIWYSTQWSVCTKELTKSKMTIYIYFFSSSRNEPIWDIFKVFKNNSKSNLKCKGKQFSGGSKYRLSIYNRPVLTRLCIWINVSIRLKFYVQCI